MVPTMIIVGFMMGLAYGKGLEVRPDILPLCALSGAVVGMICGIILLAVWR